MNASQTFNTLNFKVTDSVAGLSLSRAEARNSLDQQFWLEWPIALQQIAANSSLTVKHVKETMVSEQNRKIEQQMKLPAASSGVSILHTKIYFVASHGELNPRTRLKYTATLTAAYAFGDDIPNVLASKKSGKKPKFDDLNRP